MAKYIDILLTKDGFFCAAPPWKVHEGDMVTLPDDLFGNPLKEVISVCIDKVGGDYVKQIEKYIGYPLPRITNRYAECSIEWGDEDAVDYDG